MTVIVFYTMADLKEAAKCKLRLKINKGRNNVEH